MEDSLVTLEYVGLGLRVPKFVLRYLSWLESEHAGREGVWSRGYTDSIQLTIHNEDSVTSTVDTNCALVLELGLPITKHTKTPPQHSGGSLRHVAVRAICLFRHVFDIYAT